MCPALWTTTSMQPASSMVPAIAPLTDACSRVRERASVHARILAPVWSSSETRGEPPRHRRLSRALQAPAWKPKVSHAAYISRARVVAAATERAAEAVK